MKNERNSDNLRRFGDTLDTLGHCGALWDAVAVTLSLGGGHFPTQRLKEVAISQLKEWVTISSL